MLRCALFLMSIANNTQFKKYNKEVCFNYRRLIIYKIIGFLFNSRSKRDAFKCDVVTDTGPAFFHLVLIALSNSLLVLAKLTRSTIQFLFCHYTAIFCLLKTSDSHSLFISWLSSNVSNI